MPRLMLTDKFWLKLEKMLFREAFDYKRNLRMTIKGLLYRIRVVVYSSYVEITLS
jgi:hypothetical protein